MDMDISRMISKALSHIIYSKSIIEEKYQNGDYILHEPKRAITPLRNMNTNYFPSEIKQYVKNKISEGLCYDVCYEANIRGRQVRFHVYHMGSSSSSSSVSSIVAQISRKQTLYAEMFRHVCIWLFIAYYYSSSKCSKLLDIYFYPTHFRKQRPSKKAAAFGPLHSNTAFTYHCVPDNSIVIYRREEWYKVFIHETCHSLGLIEHRGTHGYNASNVMDLFHLPNTQVYTDETHCEMMATFWNMCLVSAQISEYKFHSSVEKRGLIDMVLYFLHEERDFALFQIRNIFHHLDIEFDDVVALQYKQRNQVNTNIQKSGNQKSGNQKSGSYQEETNIFAYYVLKGIMLFYLDDYFRLHRPYFLHSKFPKDASTITKKGDTGTMMDTMMDTMKYDAKWKQLFTKCLHSSWYKKYMKISVGNMKPKYDKHEMYLTITPEIV